MGNGLSPLERAVLEKALAGDHRVLDGLREQLPTVEVKARSFTGVGFHTELAVDLSLPKAAVSKGRVHLGDVEAEIPGLDQGAGFVVFIEDGYLAALEGFTYDEPWPNEVTDWSLTYSSGQVRDLKNLAL